MIRSIVLIGALLTATPSLSQSVKIGDGTFTVLSSEEVEHDEIKEVVLRYNSASGTARVHLILYCDTRKADYYDAASNLTEVRVRPENRNTSVSTNMWYRFCGKK